MKQFLKLIFVSAIVIPTLAMAAFGSIDWPFRKAISLPSLTEPTYVRLPLDNEVAVTNVNFRDVRVVTAGSEEPYQLLTEIGTESEAYYHSIMLNKGTDNNGNSVFILDLGQAGTLSNSLVIRSSSANYKRYVSVFAADNLLSINGTGWNKLTDQGYIVKFTDNKSGFTAGQDTVTYPDNTSRYLKIVIASGSEGAVEVNDARVYQYAVSRAKENIASYSGTLIQNDKEKSTEFALDLGRSGIPMHKVELAVTSDNFNRRVVIQSSNDGQNWQIAGNSSIFRINMDKFTGQNLMVEFPETTARYLRVIVFNQDNKPLDISSSAKVYGIARNIVFQAKPGQTYYLYYGDKTAVAPQYDLSKLFSYLDLANIRSATAGNEEQNPGYVVPKLPEKTFFEKYPQALNVMLVIVVLLIGMFLVLYIRSYHKEKMPAIPSSDDSVPPIPPTDQS